MISYLLATKEPGPVELSSVFERIDRGVVELLGGKDAEVTLRDGQPNTVYWKLTRTATFTVRISEPDLVRREAEDLASFASSRDQQAGVRNAATRFVCHHFGKGNTDELHYLLSVLSAGHDSWCFRIDDRQFISNDFDAVALFSKERLPVKLSTQGPGRHKKLLRVFGEPLPVHASGEAEFSDQAALISAEVLDEFSRRLASYGYQERPAKNGVRTFDYIATPRWHLEVGTTPREIFFSVPQPNSSNQSTLREVYQTSTQLILDLPLRMYDPLNDVWIG